MKKDIMQKQLDKLKKEALSDGVDFDELLESALNNLEADIEEKKHDMLAQVNELQERLIIIAEDIRDGKVGGIELNVSIGVHTLTEDAHRFLQKRRKH